MNEAELEILLATPTPGLVADFRRLAGDILVLGAGGKMGPSLARLAVRASQDAGTSRRVVAVSRFGDPVARRLLEQSAVETIACDLLERDALGRLPDCPNIVFMAGRKFGTTNDEAATWAANAYLPGLIAQRFGTARIVVFSTGNVYSLSPVGGRGPDEHAAPAPVGEYAQAALARERIIEYFSRANGTPAAIMRLNYAVEPRYGVLRDIADKVFRSEPIDLTMGYANVIWQRDANAIALRMLAHCASPPFVLNVTGAPAVSVRDLAQRFATRLHRTVSFSGIEGATALLSDATQCVALFGPAETTIDAMIDAVADWVASGGRSLNRPTHFQEREGRF